VALSFFVRRRAIETAWTRIDSAPGMSSHGIVRGRLDRLMATVLVVALLAGPGMVPCRAGLAAARDPSKAPDRGMNAPHGPAVAVAVPVAPAAIAAPLSATARATVAFDLPACGRPTDRVARPAIVVKSAPQILRI
jgi:hypothetical protein